MNYRVILLRNGEYKKTLYRSKTKESAFMRYHAMIDENKAVKFPRRFINTKGIRAVRYQICIIKPTETTDTFRILRDDFGKTYKEKPLGNWTILVSNKYEIEETFWVYGNDSNIKSERPTIDTVVKKLFIGAYKKKMVKQVIVVYNKLLIHNEDHFDMIICKCQQDAQRLHHMLSKAATRQKIKSLIFMGTATPATVSQMYVLIKMHTGWPNSKIWRKTTRP